jgi:hypothetical protein
LPFFDQICQCRRSVALDINLQCTGTYNRSPDVGKTGAVTVVGYRIGIGLKKSDRAQLRTGILHLIKVLIILQNMIQINFKPENL